MSDTTAAFKDVQWGYLIYRTIYTEESDKHLDLVLQRLGPYVRTGILEDRHKPWDLQFAFPLVHDKATLENATIEQLRARWNQDRANYPEVFFSKGVFMVLDESSLESFVEFADDDPAEPYQSSSPWIKMGDGSFDAKDAEHVEERRQNRNREEMYIAVQHIIRFEWMDREYATISKPGDDFDQSPGTPEIWVG